MKTANISGFGGGYEIACQVMLVQGLEWLSQHPEAKPEFHGYKGVYGIITEDNADAKDLSTAVCFGVDPTGAMHQAVMSHVLYIRLNGRAKWLQELGASSIEIPFETVEQMREYLAHPENCKPQNATQFPKAR